MILYFVRHGVAENREEWFESDDLRPLTEDGEKRMRAAARWMGKLGVRPAVILTSPLVRARQTADILAEVLSAPVEESPALEPGFGISALGELLKAYPDADSLLLVGHEPDFSATIEGLMGGGRVSVKKGSLIRVDLFSTTPPRGQLIWNIPPRMLTL